MTIVNEWLPPDVIKLSLAGLAGSLVSLATSPVPGWKANILRALSGTLSAVYIGPVFATMVSPFTASLGPNAALGLSGFIIGVSGMAAVNAVIETVRFRKDGVIIKQQEMRTEVLPATKADRIAAQAEDKPKMEAGNHAD